MYFDQDSYSYLYTYGNILTRIAIVMFVFKRMVTFEFTGVAMASVSVSFLMYYIFLSVEVGANYFGLNIVQWVLGASLNVKYTVDILEFE